MKFSMTGQKNITY